MRRIWLTGLIALVAAGCTFAATKPHIAEAPPPQPPKVLVLTDIKVGDPLWDNYKLHFTRGVTDYLKQKGGFESVVTEKPAAVQEGSVILTGTITEVDKGSTALRWIIGMGAGQAKVKGDFEIHDPKGTVLAKFAARESYLGGLGIGGAGFLDMDDLVRRFAESVAETTRKWARGEKIGSP